jgi:hypothetical protein
MDMSTALGVVRLMIQGGVSREAALANPVIPRALRDEIRTTLEREDVLILRPVTAISGTRPGSGWLPEIDRSSWYFWPQLRDFLLGVKGWPRPVVVALDEQTDRILEQMSPPTATEFDTRGLVLGYVQSGKTANYTALIAKAVDIGYRLVIVLTGMDKGLRRQTQIRLKREIVGYADNRPTAVHLPPLGKHWHEFTSDSLDGDFQPGNANQAALQGSQPVLLVVKKNGAVLRKLIGWLDAAPDEVKNGLPVLIIDDEADQASVDTRGSYQVEGQAPPPDFEEPSVINGLIRTLLLTFHRRAYVAYTATPYANILIPHDTFDPTVENDLYPKDFIIDLPKPPNYFGSEDLFGRFEPETGDYTDGLDVIREIPITDLAVLDQGNLPDTLIGAIESFALAGAARAERGYGDDAATMLLHVSHLRIDHLQLFNKVQQQFFELRDDWRYQRNKGIRARLEKRWEEEFRPLTMARYLDRDRPFSAIEEHLSTFLQKVEVKVINSDTGDLLDYERQPGLKTIAIGGNRLSRGLTLEGLLVSYFARHSANYDTLMQMGRWFGFRNGYDDLTRIWTTVDLETWFADLAFVEWQLREDLQIYEDQGLTPNEVGLRIWQHPVMQVTSKLKRRFANPTTISQSFSASIQQTFKFPLGRPEDLMVLSDSNRDVTVKFLEALGNPAWQREGPIWSGVPSETVLRFLNGYKDDAAATGLSLPLIREYIIREVGASRLQEWTVAVMGIINRKSQLGDVDWGLWAKPVHQIERSRIGETNSLGVITSPGDEAIDLNPAEVLKMHELIRNSVGRKPLGINPAARRVRSAKKGLLLIYPISRYSGTKLTPGSPRRRLYGDPDSPLARDLIAIALSFPDSGTAQPVEAYLEGTVGWTPM